MDLRGIAALESGDADLEPRVVAIFAGFFHLLASLDALLQDRGIDERAAKTFSCGTLNSRVVETFIRGSQRAPELALLGRARGAPGTPRKHECPKADRCHQPPSGLPSRSSQPKAPIREATLLRRPRDTPLLQRPSLPAQPLSVPYLRTRRLRRSQTRWPSERI